MKIKFYLTCLLTAAIFLPSIAFSQPLQPAKWQFSKEKISADEYLLHFDVKLDKNWNIYSQFIADDGPVPTSFQFEKNKKVELIGKVEESGESVKEGMDAIFEIYLKKYAVSARFTQKVKTLKGAKELKGYLEFMVCDDEKCLPPSIVDFTFSFEDGTGSLIPFQNDGDDIRTVKQKNTSPSFDFLSRLQSIFPQASAQGMFNPENNSGIFEPVKWLFRKEAVSENQYQLIFEAAVDPGWYIYSQHIGGTDDDIRPVPTSFVFEEYEGVTLDGEVEEMGDKVIEMQDPLFDDILVKKFSGKAVFTQLITTGNPNAPIKGYLEYMTCDDEKCLPPQFVDFAFGDVKVQEAPVYMEKSTRDKTLLGIFIAGFIGGLLALMTPCVFPMMPLTVSFFTKSSKTKAKGVMNAAIYGVSIIVIYVLLGFIVTKVLGADALNQMASNAFFNLTFFVVFVLFAISFFGYFEITLPAALVNKMDKASDKGGLIGIFFMAFTLALVSFSCTGPIIGTLLVEAAMRGNNLGPLVGMTGFAVALAFPFGLFAAFPGWLNSLPKSGGWLNSVKVILGFLELALALKFLSNVDLAYHWGFLKLEIFLGIWILIFFSMALYILGVIKFPHDGIVKRFSPVRVGFAIPVILFVVYLIPGLTGAPLKLLSGFPPPGFYSLRKTEGKCPHGINCFKDLKEGMAYARLVKKPVLVDFTGWSCVNCRKMEEHVWIEPDVLKYLKDDYVLISLYVDDKTPLPQSEQKVVACTNKKLKTIGNKWSAYQTCTFKTNSQPYYVLLTPGEEMLNEPVGYTPDKKQYIRFLQDGLDKFNNGDALSSLEYSNKCFFAISPLWRAMTSRLRFPPQKDIVRAQIAMFRASIFHPETIWNEKPVGPACHTSRATSFEPRNLHREKTGWIALIERSANRIPRYFPLLPYRTNMRPRQNHERVSPMSQRQQWLLSPRCS